MAPTFAGAALFVDGQTLGEPARDVVLGEPEVEHVGEFVPEDGRPVEISDGPGGGRVHSEKASEGHAESAHATQPDGPDREVAGIRIDLDSDGQRRLIPAIPFYQGLVCLFRDLFNVWLEQCRLTLVHNEEETGVVVVNVVVLEGVHEQQRIIKPHAVRISLEGRLEVGLGFLDQAEPQLIHAEDPVGSPREGVYSDGLFRQASRFEVLPALYAQERDIVVQLGVGWAEPGNLVTDRLIFTGLAAEKMTGREDAQRLQGGGVHLECPLELGSGLFVIFRLEEKSGLEDPRFDQILVLLEGHVYLIHHSDRAIEFHCTG